MSILNEASMRIGDARGQLELERLRRDREERRAAMLAQGLQTITQGGLGALQTGAQFATDYQAQKQAKEQNAAMLAFKQQQAADRAARDAAKQRIEEAKLGMTQADFASQAKLRDAKAAGEASLVQERRAEALAKMTSAGKTPDEIAKMHAGELEGLDLTGAAKPTGEDQKALARAMFGKGELPQDTGRTVLDAKVDEIAQRYEQRAAAQERVLIANGFSPEEAQANVTRMGLRPDKAALKAALLREQESRQMAQQKGKLEMGTAFNKSASEGLSLLENQAYGLAAKAVSEGRELTADDVEAFTLQQGANEADAITALAKAYDAAKKARAGVTKTTAEAEAVKKKTEKADRPDKLASPEVTTLTRYDRILGEVDNTIRFVKENPNIEMGPLKTRMKDWDQKVSSGEITNMLSEGQGTAWGRLLRQRQALTDQVGILFGEGVLQEAEYQRAKDSIDKAYGSPANYIAGMEEVARQVADARAAYVRQLEANRRGFSDIGTAGRSSRSSDEYDPVAETGGEYID